jgi:Transposase DDE domain
MAARDPWYQMQTTIAQQFPDLRPAQQRGLAVWVYGTILAHSACESAVLTALLAFGAWDGLRQRLREWLYDGADKAAPCHTQLDVSRCFAPLLRWLLRWWHGDTLALAVDATAHGEKVVALVISVLYRGTAIPIAWHILPANQKGAWMGPILRRLRQVAPAVPARMTVLVHADCGLWSPRLWKRIRDLGWHPLLRVRKETTFAPAGQRRQRAVDLVPGPGHAWVGRGVAFKHRTVRRAGTLIVVWGTEHAEPWIVLTDLAPQCVGVAWYGLRIWVELGFRALKGVGWQWQQTRRTDPERVARHWLVLAVATLWVVACGTRVEEARAAGVPPARLRTPRPAPKVQRRKVSVFRLGLAWLRQQVARGRVWQRLWLTPEPWPDPPSGLAIVRHGAS